MFRKMIGRPGFFRLTSAAFIQFLFALPGIGAEHSSDSLAFAQLVQSIVVSENNRTVIETAEALAQEGLYVEAMELVRELLIEPDTTATPAVTFEQRQWRIALGTDYYHIEDPDTALLTAEEILEYNRLIETPLSVWTRIKFNRRYKENSPVQEIVPELYVSERKATVNVPLRMVMAAKRFMIKGSVGAAKWFKANASGSTPFEPAQGQPSDMGKGSLSLMGQSQRTFEKRLFWRIPITLSWEHYRKNRPGYESCVEYGFSPGTEWRGTSTLAGVGALLDCRYKDYYNDGADSLDVVRVLGRINGDLHFGRGTVIPAVALFADRYTGHMRLQDVGRIDCSLRSEYPFHERITGRLAGRVVYEHERYRPTSSTSRFSLDGSESIVRPSLRVSISENLTLESELSAEIRKAAQRDILHDTTVVRRYLWESRRSLEPALRLFVSLPAIDASLRGMFRSDNSDPEFEQYIADSRLYRVVLESSATLLSFITINLFADYQYRDYAPYNAGSRKTENATVSANVAMRF